MGFRDKLVPGIRQRKLLAIDGGGIRGMIAIELLAKIEALLQEKSGRGEKFVLSDYFDYVAGTSTGAIIATCIALGMRVDRIRSFYIESGPDMFSKAGLLKRLRYKFEDEPLAEKLKTVIGGETTLGDDTLQTLLMIVMRNATTDSPWPISNNPAAKYCARDRDDCNLDLPLWQLVRASTAAPTYFPPEVVPVGKQRFIFVDGGMTMYNNPAFQLFLMATAEPYQLKWETGADKMLLISLGTGTAPNANQGLSPEQMNLLYNASSIPSALMFAASNEQDFLCRVFGKTLAGDMLDREVGTMIGRGIPDVNKLFTYARYNAELTREGLDELELHDIRPESVQRLDSIEGMDDLQRVGARVAERKIQAEHFAGFD